MPGHAHCARGGYVNTELRQLAEPRLFDCVDFVTLDAGERPLLSIIEHLQGQRGPSRLQRCFRRVDDQVTYTDLAEPDFAFDDVGTPTWLGLPMDQYLSLLDLLNNEQEIYQALSDFRELESEYKSLGGFMDDKRAIIRAEVAKLGGKAKLDGVASVSIVPASESHSYDTDAIDDIVLELYADGTKDGIAIAQKLIDARKKTVRKESLRITLDKGW